jgi:HK97 family phage major capsid protein
MTPEEMQVMLDAKFTKVQSDLAEAQKNNASKENLEELIDSVKVQGEALDEFIANQEAKVVKGILGQFGDFILANKSKLETMKENKAGEITFVPKLVADITTGSGSDIDTVPLDVSTNLGHFNLRNDNSMLGLMTVSSTNSPSYPYTEMTPKEGGYAFVLEGGSKPQIDFKWENRYETPKKCAAHEILTEESVTDYPRLMSVAKEYLVKQHDLFKVDAAFFADGTGDNPTGATVYGRTFVSTGMVDAFPLGTSNFMDVVNACITDIYRTQGFVNEAHYQPNIVLVNPVDFFLQLVGAKDGNGLPLYPQAGLFNEIRIGGVRIKPWIKIPLGKIFVADMKKYNVVNYVPFSIRVGWINDQFITNKFTLVGESRYFQYVKNLDQAAFIYDDIATVQAAITAAS